MINFEVKRASFHFDPGRPEFRVTVDMCVCVYMYIMLVVKTCAEEFMIYVTLTKGFFSLRTGSESCQGSPSIGYWGLFS
jgi:hypothetical protein